MCVGGGRTGCSGSGVFRVRGFVFVWGGGAGVWFNARGGDEQLARASWRACGLAPGAVWAGLCPVDVHAWAGCGPMLHACGT